MYVGRMAASGRLFNIGAATHILTTALELRIDVPAVPARYGVCISRPSAATVRLITILALFVVMANIRARRASPRLE